MNWLLWLLAFVGLGVPVGSLTIDRVFGIPARTQWKYWGVPSLIAFLIALFGGLASDNGVAALILWGIVSGVLATAALDIVRLFGHHILHAFPLDMPQMFGTIAYGLAPQLQRNVIGQMVKFLSEAPEEQRRMMMAERLRAIAGMSEPLRQAVVGAMQRGLAQLPEDRRQTVMSTQLGVLTDLAPQERRAIMAAMDVAMAGQAQPTYAQPRGLPKIPMDLARRFFSVALPQTWQEAGLPPAKPTLAGYIWHFIIGVTFAVTYNLLFGHGTWALAFGWGIFVWAAMMIAMPPMMPLIKFPWWFPIVPFVAHIAMAIPIGYVALNFISPAAHAASLVGALGWLP
jgi:hypothetical protein